MVLGFVLIGQLLNKRWRQAAICAAGILAMAFVGAKSVEFGIRNGHWNEIIHQHCVRDSGPNAAKCP